MANAFLKRLLFMDILKLQFSTIPERYRTHLFSGMPFLLFLLFTLYNTTDLRAQRVAVKTNLTDWMTASPNLSAEFTISSRLSIDLAATATPFKYKPDFYFRHVRLQPELRYWLLTPLSRHYVGFTAFYSTYDVGYKKRGYFGDSYAAGLTYGYNWVLSRRWNFELSAGVGAIHYRLARYTPGTAHPEPNDSGWLVAPVKLGITFVYVIK